MVTLRRSHGGILAALIAIPLLTGCTTGAPDATAVPSPSEAAPSSSAEPTPEPVVEPSPEPTSTCDTVLTEAEYASLDEDGLKLDQDPWMLGPAMEELATDGALTCEWHRSGGDISAWYAQLAEDDVAWAGRRARLEATGWTVSDDPFAGTMLAPADYDANYQPSMLNADGVTYFASYARFLGSVAALQ